jgi:type I restriction-modification system DNA methylase subunit
MADRPITADQVHAETIARHGADGVTAERLGETYESMQKMADRLRGGVWYTPQRVANAITRLSLEAALKQVGPEDPEQIFRIVVCDPACGCGVFLVEAAWLLAAHYAGRLVRAQPSTELLNAVLPTVILACIHGIEIDPVAAELARLALSRETGGIVHPTALARNVICGNTLAGDSPPAMEERLGAGAAPHSPD